MCAFSWHCHSMKSLNRVTLLVLMNMSSGGHSAVYVWLFMVSAVMFSAFGNLRGLVVVDCKGGDSGSKAVVEDIESSTSDFAPESGDVSLIKSRESVRLEWFDLIFCVILDCENGALDG